MSESVSINALKNIVDKLNKVFQLDYNVSSFDSIRGNGLLLIIIKILREFLMLKGDEDLTNLPVIILDMLKSIKYMPEKQFTPEAFRTGLAAASKDIVYPILTFLLDNEHSIKKRFYLSKFVNKIDVPQPFLTDDAQMQQLYQQYHDIIDQFWLVYSENVREENIAKENAELEADVFQMKKELRSLEKRIAVQSKKIDLSEHSVEEIRELVQERKRHEKLTKQLEGDRECLNKYLETIRNYNRRDITTSLEDLFQKSEYYANAQQVYERSLKEILEDLEITEKVSQESFIDDLEELKETQNILQRTVNQLNRDKQQDDALSAMQNQQMILSKRKAVLSKQVIKIRLRNEQVLNKVDEWSQILDGDVLRGRQFKKYVYDLKLMSYTYKKNHSHIKAMANEDTVLKRTLELLHELEPDLKANILKSCNDTPEELKDLPLEDVRSKVMRLFKQQETLLKTCYEEESKYQRVKDMFSDNLIQFDAAKHAFDEQTGNIMEQTDKVQRDVQHLEVLLKVEEEDLRVQEEEFEKLQDSLLRYSQMFIDTAGEVTATTQDIMKSKLQTAQNALDELRRQADMKQQALYAQETEIQMTKGVIALITHGKMKN